jgi:uncharacterized protein involved in response to NO
MAATSPPRVPGSAVFFPMAAAYAAVVLPASVAAMTGMTGAFPGLATPAGHAHEMLFGFALAVVAGNQLGLRTRGVVVVLVSLWMIARVAFVFAPHGRFTTLADVAFPVLLAGHLAPRLLGSAKKWRNRALPVMLAAICGSAVVVAFIVHGVGPPQEPFADPHRVLRVAVALFALLLLFMGGRITAPTVAGQLQRQGIAMPARVQPRVEGALIALMLGATIALAASPEPADGPQWMADAAGAALIAAGALAAVRLARWRLWALRGRPDLWCLAAGSAWLALGLVLLGMAQAGLVLGSRETTAALHVITIGSLGTLTLNVMAMTALSRVRDASAALRRLPVVGTLLLAAAVALRLAAGRVGDLRTLLVAAAMCWAAAFALLFVLLLHARLQARPRHARAVVTR